MIWYNNQSLYEAFVWCPSVFVTGTQVRGKAVIFENVAHEVGAECGKQVLSLCGAVDDTRGNFVQTQTLSFNKPLFL